MRIAKEMQEKKTFITTDNNLVQENTYNDVHECLNVNGIDLR